MNGKNENINMNETETEKVTDKEYISLACEAILFACGSAVTFSRMAEILETGVTNIRTSLDVLKKSYDESQRAIDLLIFDDCAQLVTKSEYYDIVRRALELRRNQPLSKAALEVLAITAYNQPVTRAFIDKVRGVESPSIVSTLIEKGLIGEVGRLDAPGKPMLFGTTSVFLRTFGLSDLSELGRAPELSELNEAIAAKYAEAVKEEEERNTNPNQLSIFDDENGNESNNKNTETDNNNINNIENMGNGEEQ